MGCDLFSKKNAGRYERGSIEWVLKGAARTGCALGATAGVARPPLISVGKNAGQSLQRSDGAGREREEQRGSLAPICANVRLVNRLQVVMGIEHRNE